MLTLYYSSGACSMAPHIALEEAGAPYALQLVSIPKGDQQAPEYLKNVNPHGKVPALRTELLASTSTTRRPSACTGRALTIAGMIKVIASILQPLAVQ
jgi:Glutathione S-transferase, N-terminal domain